MASSYQEIFEYNEKWIVRKPPLILIIFIIYPLNKTGLPFIGCSDSRVDPDTFTGLK